MKKKRQSRLVSYRDTFVIEKCLHVLCSLCCIPDINVEFTLSKLKHKEVDLLRKYVSQDTPPCPSSFTAKAGHSVCGLALQRIVVMTKKLFLLPQTSEAMPGSVSRELRVKPTDCFIIQ